jgi:hypothetical protein
MKTTHWEVHYSVDGVTWWRLYYGLISLDQAKEMINLEKAASAEHYTFKIFE